MNTTLRRKEYRLHLRPAAKNYKIIPAGLGSNIQFFQFAIAQYYFNCGVFGSVQLKFYILANRTAGPIRRKCGAAVIWCIVQQ